MTRTRRGPPQATRQRMTQPRKIAVVLFNLGGPDHPGAVAPFLFNLFNDPAIIALPQPLRWAVAKLISRRRAPVAKHIYDQMGGRSPILPETEAQAAALERQLQAAAINAKTFVAMRYWHPRADDVARRVKAYDPDAVILLPLYPQFSTTTTRSSLDEWHRAALRCGLDAPSREICCYPTAEGLIAAQATLLQRAVAEATAAGGAVRVLFSAHGLPKRLVEKTADPYPEHVRLGAEAIVRELARCGTTLSEWRICFQSRVGPLEWIGPSTESEIRRGGRDGRALVVLPIAFVSEHSETLVELDIEYRDLARACGVAAYVRVPTVGTTAAFIAALAAMVSQALARDGSHPVAPGGERGCPAGNRACPAAQAE